MKWERWKAYIEVCRDATSDSSTEQTSLNKALLCSSHSHRLSISLSVCLSLSSQPASLVSFSLSALLFSPQLSTLLYCLWKLGWRLFSAYFFCMQIVLYHQHLSCSLVTNDSPPHPPFFPFFWTKQMPEANANGKSTILHLVRAVTKMVFRGKWKAHIKFMTSCSSFPQLMLSFCIICMGFLQL
jgi:hypothetical protein